MNRALTGMGAMMVTSGGLGFLRPASGTWGSLPPVALAAVMMAIGAPCWVFGAAMIVVVVVFSLACISWGDAAEAAYGEKDPSNVVADETAGMGLTLLAATGVHGAWAQAGILGAAFLAFRVMDILKPPPARGLQRVPGGWGILLDDLVAGVMAVVVVVGARWGWGV